MPEKRTTIADVAERVGVSKSTVSHALSGKRPISEKTRERIFQVIEELGYQPHPVAQRLAGGQTRTIGFVFPLYSPQIAGLEMKFITGAANVINQADDAFMSSAGYGLFLHTAYPIVYRMGSESSISYSLHVADSQLDYFLIYGPLRSSRYQGLRRS